MSDDARPWMDLPPAFGDRREALFGGAGAVRVWELLPDEATDPFAAALACELDADGAVGAHVQSHHAEIVICLDGLGTAIVGGEARDLSPGVSVYVPLGVTLALRNDARDAPLRYLIVKAAPTQRA